jgi:hypothetical protein
LGSLPRRYNPELFSQMIADAQSLRRDGQRGVDRSR